MAEEPKQLRATRLNVEKRNNRGKHYKPPNAPVAPMLITPPPSAPESKTDLYGLIAGVLFGFFLAVVFVPDSAFTLYVAWVCVAVVLIWSIYKFSRWSRLVNAVLVAIGLAVIGLVAFTKHKTDYDQVSFMSCRGLRYSGHSMRGHFTPSLKALRPFLTRR